MSDDPVGRYTGSLKRTTSEQVRKDIKPGPYMGIVRNHLDPKFMGNLEIELLHKVDSGNKTGEENQMIQARYLSPFAGTTPREGIQDNPGHEFSQKSYGMWFVPPDPGTLVLVLFVEGGQAFWVGCIPDDYVNIMTPAGDPSTTYNTQDRSKRLPVGEYNKKRVDAEGNDPTRFEKPVNTDVLDVLEKQGLTDDETRGLTSSSARREVPSTVFGISTPGPQDKREKAPSVNYGPNKQKAQVPHNRLGGSSLVFDDGDETLLRKGRASETPPEYANKEAGERGGDVTRPHNEMTRLKTRTGHQILMHNSEELIYVCNANGTAWVELTANGKIDVYSKDSISLHTEEDFNIKADRDVNIEADRDFNVKTKKNIALESVENTQLIVGQDNSITTKGKFDLNTKKGNKFTAGEKTEINSGGNHVETAEQIHMNGPKAQKANTATPLPTFELPGGSNTENVIMKRVPQHEPWTHHENLSPTNFKSNKTNIKRSDQVKEGEFRESEDVLESSEFTGPTDKGATGGVTAGVTEGLSETSFKEPSEKKKKELACSDPTPGFEFCFTFEKFSEIVSNNDEKKEWYDLFKEKLPEYGITTEKRVASFISQVAHESRNFTQLRENLNFTSSNRIRTVYGNRFPDERFAPPDLVGQPEKTANFVYANILGNGPFESGDGYKFRGGGLMQLTGRVNYEAFANDNNLTINEAVDYVETKEGALVSALWFWKTNGLNGATESGGVPKVTEIINGGFIGLDQRRSKFSKALAILSAGNENEGLNPDGAPKTPDLATSNDTFRKSSRRTPSRRRV